MVAQRRGWVLLSYHLPREPSTPRIKVWRKLRRLGVAQVGDGLVALPEDPRTLEQLEWVAADVDAAAGTATVWRAEIVAGRDEDRLVAEMSAARAKEYRELIDRVRQAHSDSTAEPDRRRMEQLRRELRQIRRRDFFPPPEAEQARQWVEGAAAGAARTGAGGPACIG